jgi:putative cell wall-binding protein
LPSVPFRRTVLAGAVAVAMAAVGGGLPAQASHLSSPANLGGPLTASNGGSTIAISGGATPISVAVCEDTCSATTARDAQWSPDGTRVTFVNGLNEIESTLSGNRGLEWHTSAPAAGTQRQSPTFDSTGQFLVWAERAGATQPWHLAVAGATQSSIVQVQSLLTDSGYDFTNPDAGPNNKLAYQRNTDVNGTSTGTPEVWVGDFDTGQTTQLIVDGSQPAISDTKVAFVRSDGAHQQIFVAPYDATGAGQATQLTTDAVDHTNPTFDADGSHITFSRPGGALGTVAVTGGADTAVSGLTGVPAYQTRQKDTVYRLAGTDRFSTSVQVAKSHWADGGADAVVLSRSDTFADALSGSSLAAAKHGPLLLTPTDSLNALTSAEIKRVLGAKTTAKVYLLGSAAVLSTAVENAVKALGYQTVRLAGADRFATSAAIANEITPNPEFILAATGMNFPDALAAGAAAGAWTTTDTPTVLVLTADATLPAATKTYLDGKKTSATIVPIGAQAKTAVSGYSNKTAAISGSSRYETAARVAEAFFDATAFVGVATGTNWPDALAGGALLGTLGGPLLLTDGTASDLHLYTAMVLGDRSAGITSPVVLGSAAVVSDTLRDRIGSAVSLTYGTADNPTDLTSARTAALGGGAKQAAGGAKSLIAGKADRKASLKQRIAAAKASARQ